MKQAAEALRSKRDQLFGLPAPQDDLMVEPAAAPDEQGAPEPPPEQPPEALRVTAALRRKRLRSRQHPPQNLSAIPERSADGAAPPGDAAALMGGMDDALAESGGPPQEPCDGQSDAAGPRRKRRRPSKQGLPVILEHAEACLPGPPERADPSAPEAGRAAPAGDSGDELERLLAEDDDTAAAALLSQPQPVDELERLLAEEDDTTAATRPSPSQKSEGPAAAKRKRAPRQQASDRQPKPKAAGSAQPLGKPTKRLPKAKPSAGGTRGKHSKQQHPGSEGPLSNVTHGPATETPGKGAVIEPSSGNELQAADGEGLDLGLWLKDIAALQEHQDELEAEMDSRA